MTTGQVRLPTPYGKATFAEEAEEAEKRIRSVPMPADGRRFTKPPKIHGYILDQTYGQTRW